MVLQIIYIFKWLTWLSNDIQIISIMLLDKDILENCLFNSGGERKKKTLLSQVEEIQRGKSAIAKGIKF